MSLLESFTSLTRAPGRSERQWGIVFCGAAVPSVSCSCERGEIEAGSLTDPPPPHTHTCTHTSPPFSSWLDSCRCKAQRLNWGAVSGLRKTLNTVWGKSAEHDSQLISRSKTSGGRESEGGVEVRHCLSVFCEHQRERDRERKKKREGRGAGWMQTACNIDDQRVQAQQDRLTRE